MAVLYARVGGAWVTVGGGSDEVFIGATAPTDSAVELWYDTAAVPAKDPAKMPRGLIGYAGQSAQQTGIGAAATDLTGCSVTWTATTDRLYRISLILPRAVQNTTTAEQRLAIRNAANANLVINTKGVTAGQATDHNLWVIIGNLSGSQTVKASLLTGAGTVDTTAGFLAVILVEDIGGV